MSKRGWPHVDDPASVGMRLKEARLAAGLSQRELSFPGCTAVYICRIERGDRVPSLQVLRELARRLYVREEFLAKGETLSHPLHQWFQLGQALSERYGDEFLAGFTGHLRTGFDIRVERENRQEKAERLRAELSELEAETSE